MKKYAEEKTEWKPSRQEAMELSSNIKAFSPVKINGRTQYPFEQYLSQENIISFGPHGEWQVKNPFQFARMSKTNSLLEWITDKELEAALQIPEEKEAYEDKRRQWMMDCRAVLERFRVIPN